jgi:hypothetical protein
MIVKVKFSEELTMMFGDSYKPWYMQFDEYFWQCKEKLPNPISIETAPDKWIGWGGLKWCPESKMQEQFNREGCQENEPDNPTPRQYLRIKFKDNPFVTAKVNKIVKECRG